MTYSFTESIVEDAALAWLDALGYTVKHGPDIAVGEASAERTDADYRDVVLAGRLRQVLRPVQAQRGHAPSPSAQPALVGSDRLPDVAERAIDRHALIAGRMVRIGGRRQSPEDGFELTLQLRDGADALECCDELSRAVRADSENPSLAIPGVFPV